MSISQTQRASRAANVGVAVLVAILLLSGVQVVATDVSGDAWLSGPAALWYYIIGGDPTGTAATNLKNAVKSDFANAIAALDSGAGVTINSMTPYTAPATGPAYGTSMAYTITTTTLTAAQIESCLRAAALTNLNSLFSSLVSSPTITITVLNADTPSAVTQVSDGYLPLNGGTYLWQMLLGILNAAGAAALSGFVVPLTEDLQSTVDSTSSLYLVVVPTDTTESILNASSLYMRYSVWAYPSNPTPATAAATMAKAKTSTLPKFNTFITNLATTYTGLADYSDFLPTSVKTWTPLLPNPSASSSSGAVVVETKAEGNYLLTFRGDANVWGRVWASQRVAVSATVIASAEATLVRQKFVTTVQVVSAATVPNEKIYVGGLRIVCFISNGYALNASHPWAPEDIVSMLLQGDYSATQALYVAAASTAGGTLGPLRTGIEALASASVPPTPGSLATTGIDYDFSEKMLPYVIGMIAMAAIIGFFGLLAFFIACGCCCCCRQCISIKRETTPEWEADLDRYQRGMRNQDEAFAQSENPREGKSKKAAGVASGAQESEDASYTPNPLRTPDNARLHQPREGHADDNTRSPQKSTPPLVVAPTPMDVDEVVKKPPQQVYTAQGVPLEAMQAPAEEKPYAQYYKPSTPPPLPVQATPIGVTAPPPQDEDERSGNHSGTRQYRRTVSFTDEKRDRPAKAPPAASQRPSPTPDAENGTGYAPQYMANMSPTAFYNPLVTDPRSSDYDTEALNQTRLSQGSDTKSGGTPSPPPPPAYRHYESPRGNHAAAAPAYPSSDLYS